MDSGIVDSGIADSQNQNEFGLVAVDTLMEEWEAHSPCRIVVSAPAGKGKTTVVKQFVAKLLPDTRVEVVACSESGRAAWSEVFEENPDCGQVYTHVSQIPTTAREKRTLLVVEDDVLGDSTLDRWIILPENLSLFKALGAMQNLSMVFLCQERLQSTVAFKDVLHITRRITWFK